MAKVDENEFRGTPGPWVVSPHKQNGAIDYYVQTSGGDGIAYAYPQGRSQAEKEANANVMAAGPDMLEALQKIAEGNTMAESGLESWQFPDIIQQHYRIAAAAIAKALGKKEVGDA